MVFSVEKAHTEKVTCLDVGETGGVLVTGGQDRNVNLWAFGNHKCFMTLKSHTRSVDCVKFAHQDNSVYSADEIGIIKQWDMNTDDQTTYHGHMKSVRTIDFHPYSPYFVSGSNDTTIRLWDMKRNSECLAKYRGHLTNVNQVQFSPDGLWVASAGAEGTILIWEIRMSAQIMEFLDSTAAVSCIQFHPSDFLLAAGRTDGTVDIFDLEAKLHLTRLHINAGTVKCCVFSDSGDCLYVGTDTGVAVVGWEPDREICFFKSTWKSLLDMKLIGNRLICGSSGVSDVLVHSINVAKVGETVAYPSTANPFVHNQRVRKSFQRKEPAKSSERYRGRHRSEDVVEETTSHSSLSIGIVDDLDETLTNERVNLPDFLADDDSSWRAGLGGDDTGHNSLSMGSSSSPSYEPSPELHLLVTKSDNIQYSRGPQEYQAAAISPTRRDVARFEERADEFMNIVPFKNTINVDTSSLYTDLGYRSDSGYNNGGIHDFPVNSATPPDYAPKMGGGGPDHGAALPVPKARMVGRQKTSIGFATDRYSSSSSRHVSGNGEGMAAASNLARSKKLMNSRSVTNLSEISKPATRSHRFKGGLHHHQQRSSSPVRPLKNDCNWNASKENNGDHSKTNNGRSAKNSNIKVEIFTRPTRSRSTLDMRAIGASASSAIPTPRARATAHNGHSNAMHFERDGGGAYSDGDVLIESSSDAYELQQLYNGHDATYQELCNRHASLTMTKEVVLAQDILMAIRRITRLKDQAVLVDVLGAILEKASYWTLDMTVTLLPELYELLQSDRKFHCTRACDTLRVILTNFLPLIKENSGSWAAHSLGVDISSEDRYKKCAECRKWLLMIRSIPENRHVSSTLSQLQNLIVDI